MKKKKQQIEVISRVLPFPEEIKGLYYITVFLGEQVRFKKHSLFYADGYAIYEMQTWKFAGRRKWGYARWRMK